MLSYVPIPFFFGQTLQCIETEKLAFSHVVSNRKMNQPKKLKSKHKGSDIKKNKQILLLFVNVEILPLDYENKALKKRSFVM